MKLLLTYFISLFALAAAATVEAASMDALRTGHCVGVAKAANITDAKLFYNFIQFEGQEALVTENASKEKYNAFKGDPKKAKKVFEKMCK